ncbi:hypothetical protein B0H13DRAFT_1873175 [Mycena leptocephala]|nr:hypothetical protein B0H13DRAFT_1873175 [Mycena leptocephala]
MIYINAYQKSPVLVMVTQQFGGTWPSFNANATKALVSEPAQHLNEKRRRHISSSSNTLAMQLRSPQTRDEIALHQEWDDGAASTVVASEVMHSPSARRNVNAFGHPEGQDSKSSFGTTSLAIEDLSAPDLHLHFQVSTLSSTERSTAVFNSMIIQEEDYTPRASVGPQNYHEHSSINNHETMLASSDSRHGNLHSTGRSYGVVCATASETHGDHGGRPYTSQSAYQPSYHATTTGEHGRPSSAAESSRSHSQRPRSPFPRLEPHPPCLHLAPATVVQDFVSMNDTFISTDLPEDSPFTVIPADGQRESFPGYPYPEGRRLTQTFKSRRWHASFVGRARSHVHRGQWMRRTISLAGNAKNVDSIAYILKKAGAGSILVVTKTSLSTPCLDYIMNYLRHPTNILIDFLNRDPVPNLQKLCCTVPHMWWVPHGSTRGYQKATRTRTRQYVPDRPAGFKPVRVTRGYVRTRGTLRVGGSIANHRNNGKNVIRALFRGDYIITLAQMKYGPDVSASERRGMECCRCQIIGKMSAESQNKVCRIPAG